MSAVLIMTRAFNWTGRIVARDTATIRLADADMISIPGPMDRLHIDGPEIVERWPGEVIIMAPTVTSVRDWTLPIPTPSYGWGRALPEPPTVPIPRASGPGLTHLVGQPVLVLTFGLHYTGRLARVAPLDLTVTSAARIYETGPIAQMFRAGPNLCDRAQDSATLRLENTWAVCAWPLPIPTPPHGGYVPRPYRRTS